MAMSNGPALAMFSTFVFVNPFATNRNMRRLVLLLLCLSLFSGCQLMNAVFMGGSDYQSAPAEYKAEPTSGHSDTR